jgi:hypothetical protein
MQALRRSERVQQAMQHLVRGAQGVLRRSQDLIDALTAETARQEARLEVALDGQADGPASGASPAANESPADADVAAFENEVDAKQRQARARETIQQIKQAMGDRTRGGAGRRATQEGGSSVSSDAPEADTDEDENPSGDDGLPDKTIGRMPNRKKES